LESKLEHNDFDFAGVYFPSGTWDCFGCKFQESASFHKATFHGAAQFAAAIFSGEANFKGVSFRGEVNFTAATFQGKANFTTAMFSGEAYFNKATFNREVYFDEVTFGEGANFRNTLFQGEVGKTSWGLVEATSFSAATFRGIANFDAAAFSDTSFARATFENIASFHAAAFYGRVSFYYAAFKMHPTLFRKATFNNGVNFRSTRFHEGAIFTWAIFSDLTDFGSTRFSGATTFAGATFSGMASFDGATINEVHFYASTIKESMSLSKLKTFPQTRIGFEHAMIEKPERISFHTTHLRPNWFVDVDPQKFDFADVEWFRLPNEEELELEDEIKALELGQGLNERRESTQAGKRLPKANEQR